MKKLYNATNYTCAEEKVGFNNFTNEKSAIKDSISTKFDTLIGKP